MCEHVFVYLFVCETGNAYFAGVWSVDGHQRAL